MALRCESCGVQNPSANRFCGQCGIKLEHTAIAPEGSGESPAPKTTPGVLKPPPIFHPRSLTSIIRSR